MYVSQEAETLAVHSLLTIQDTEAIKRNLRNLRKQWVFAQRVTYFDLYSNNRANKLQVIKILDHILGLKQATKMDLACCTHY